MKLAVWGLDPLVPFIQILVAIHVIKTGRSWYWLWIVFGFPSLA